ncbi:hypothetical protein JHK87_036947 [Glycine soja]|nr:hypothetical protein JHK87_036947 [Glycine soja]
MGKGTVRFGVDHATPKLEPNEAKHVAPIVSSYNERIRPVLDAVENLRRLNITKEGIQLPTIVVVGDQSSGKNRIGDESYEDARAEEANLFRTHTLLSKIDKPIVGVPVLAQKLVLLQAASISKILPEIVKKINDKLGSQLSELDKFPRKLTYGANAMSAFMHIIGLAKESLSKILLSGEFDEYPDDKHICTVPLLSSLTRYGTILRKWCAKVQQAKSSQVALDSFGLVQVSHLIEYQTLLPEAFDLKMRLTAYWKIVLRRLIDSTALHLQFRIFNPVKKDVGYEIVKDVMSQCGGGIQRLLKESPSVALNRDKLNRSIKVLRESKKVVASITDKVSSYGN